MSFLIEEWVLSAGHSLQAQDGYVVRRAVPFFFRVPAMHPSSAFTSGDLSTKCSSKHEPLDGGKVHGVGH